MRDTSSAVSLGQDEDSSPDLPDLTLACLAVYCDCPKLSSGEAVKTPTLAAIILFLGLSHAFVVPAQNKPSTGEVILSDFSYSDDIRSSRDYSGEYTSIQFEAGSGRSPDYPYEARTLVLEIQKTQISGSYSVTIHQPAKENLIQKGRLENVTLEKNQFKASVLLNNERIHLTGRFVIQIPFNKGPTPRGLLVDGVFYEKMEHR